MLSSKVSCVPGVGPSFAKRLEKLGIISISDLIHHYPSRYLDYTNPDPINLLSIGVPQTIKGQIQSIANVYTKNNKNVQIARVSDKTGLVEVVWFNQRFLLKTLHKGTTVIVIGTLNWFGKKRSFFPTEYEIVSKKSGFRSILPIYPETKGISSRWLRKKTAIALEMSKNEIKEFLPKNIIKKHKLLEQEKAINFIHFPNTLSNAEKAKYRLAFNELFFIQVANCCKRKNRLKTTTAHKISVQKKEVSKFIKSLPFVLTKSQLKSINEVLDDLDNKYPMNRLLEGDVGSGKTIVAATACLASFLNGHQSVIMAPTQILARQHFQTLSEVFSRYKIRISLVTSKGIEGDAGKSDVFVGTHALIHKKLSFDNVSLVVIDEQHRFGVEQRAHLATKTKSGMMAPHTLTMTATPIPRTIVLTMYGNLDLSTLTELPGERIKITTWVVPPQKRDGAYTWIKEKIENENIQVYVICPLIEKSEAETMLEVKAATNEYHRLSKLFPEFSLSLLHGKLKPEEKGRILDSFKAGEIDILVSTSVIEVGIDTANAAIIIIEAAERFGLAQLHQLRGRVGRGVNKSYCLLFTETKSQKSLLRLNALKSVSSGFELAELDLKIRGPGEVFGTKQHGFPELKIASWNDEKLINLTKKIATNLSNNPKLFPKLVKYVDRKLTD